MARILLVDDDPAVLDALRRTLIGMGHEVTVAQEGSEALRLYVQDPADVVLTDLIMPGREGVELIQDLRRRSPQAKIVAMSGGGRVDARDLLNIARHLGADRVLAKPFTEEELQEALEVLLPGA